MLPCHSFQNYGAWRGKEVGEGFKFIIWGENHKRVGPIFIGGADPSRHLDLIYGSTLIRNQANFLQYEQLILNVRICKVLFKSWRFQIKIVGCIISVQACDIICAENTHSTLLCNWT